MEFLLASAVSSSYSTTASFAETASYAENAANIFPFTGDAIISGSLGVTGSLSLRETAAGDSGQVVSTIGDTYASTAEATKIVTLTQTEYDAIGTKDANTLYVISGSFVSSGTSGTSGESGTSGIDGTNGTAGTSGDSGTSGVDGTSGTSGNTPTVSPFTGSFDVTGSFDLVGPANGNVESVALASSTASIDLSKGSFFSSSINNTTRVEFSNVTAGITAQVELTTIGTPAVSFGANVLQPSGSGYTPSDAGARDILTITSLDGSNVFVVSANKFE
jgi:hypothetical protein